MKKVGIEKTVISSGFFTVYEKPLVTLNIKLVFVEDNKNVEASCPQLVFCTEKGIANVDQIRFVLTNCFLTYSTIATLTSEDGLLKSALVGIPVVNLQTENYYQVVITYANSLEGEKILGKGKFLYLP